MTTSPIDIPGKRSSLEPGASFLEDYSPRHFGWRPRSKSEDDGKVSTLRVGSFPGAYKTKKFVSEILLKTYEEEEESLSETVTCMRITEIREEKRHSVSDGMEEVVTESKKTVRRIPSSVETRTISSSSLRAPNRNSE